MSDPAIESVVESLQWIFTVVIGLAIAEAISQVVGNNRKQVSPSIQLRSLPAVVSFMAIIVPFFHGMSRYLYDVYRISPQPSTGGIHYGVFLGLDCLIFTIEAFVFFVLARSLALGDSRRFYRAVLFLLAVDVLWGSFVWSVHTDSIKWWVMVNGITWPILFVFRARSDEARFWFVYAPVIILLRTGCDYALTWSFYFP